MNTVCVAVIHHRHGSDAYVDRTRKGLLKLLREYAEEWLDEVQMTPEQLPADDEEAVNMYFDATDGQEYVDIFVDEEIEDECGVEG